MMTFPAPDLRLARRLTPLLGLFASACLVGPNYHRPDAPPSPAFKEAPSASNGWRPAEPLDAIPKGSWWSVFNDPVLDGLERRVQVSNQNVAAAAAAYQEARALVAESRAALFPVVSAGLNATRSGSGGGRGSFTTTTTTAGAGGTPIVSSSGSSNVTTYSPSLGASWAVDLWGSIRRQIEANRAAAQASAAQLENAALTAQAELAADYFTLRVLDEEARIYDQEIKAFQEALRVVRNQYQAGVIPEVNVITQQASLLSAQSAQADLGVQRAQYEHAIAILVGVAPSELSIAPAPLNRVVPVAPAGLPSVLLQRRPDIAAAERTMKEENALIGVQVAAYYPSLNLTADGGFSGNNLGNLFRAANGFWSLGADVSETLIDFGARRARVRAARAAYDQAVAAYRETVLTAFQGVEDELAALRIYEGEAATRQLAAQQADLAQKLTLNEYKAGTVDFTTVVTAETTALADELAVLQILAQRQVAAVTLIEDLGGGWSAAELPKT